MKDESIQTQNKFIDSAIRGKILVNKCRNCGQLMLETVYYCPACSKSDFELVEFDGVGTVVTHTIQAVAPEGFEDLDSYAWVVFNVDNTPIRASGFLPGIKVPADLPIGSKVKVTGYDKKHGLSLQKLP
ncbi:MAG: nucleotide-binding protein [Thermoproteota archaeon]|nr:nucleotide-binding protein [Thermoproteota archaeon]